MAYPMRPLALLVFDLLSAPNLWFRCWCMFALITMLGLVPHAGLDPTSFYRYSRFSGLMVHNDPLLFQLVTRTRTVTLPACDTYEDSGCGATIRGYSLGEHSI